MTESYNNGVTDEFIIPFVVVDGAGKPVAQIRDEDVCINFNFRADRAREITRALTRESGLNNRAAATGRMGSARPDDSAHRDSEELHYLCMTQYDELYEPPLIMPAGVAGQHPGQCAGPASLRNLRVAETEKFAHVTYFFNGGIEKPFPARSAMLIPSLKVATYDLAPEMRAEAIGDAIVKAVNDTRLRPNRRQLRQRRHGGPLRQAGADDQGHRGHGRAAGPHLQGMKEKNGVADHRRPRQRRADGRPGDRRPHTAHTTNPVPLIYVAEDAKNYRLRTDGSLRDISPTLLNILNIDLPKEMTGGDLRVPLAK